MAGSVSTGGRRRWRTWVLLALGMSFAGVDLISYWPGTGAAYYVRRELWSEPRWWTGDMRSTHLEVEVNRGLLTVEWRSIPETPLMLAYALFSWAEEYEPRFIRWPDIYTQPGFGGVLLPLWYPTALCFAGAAWSWRRNATYPPGRRRRSYNLTADVWGRCRECALPVGTAGE